jgi:hypothetical protein
MAAEKLLEIILDDTGLLQSNKMSIVKDIEKKLVSQLVFKSRT